MEPSFLHEMRFLLENETFIRAVQALLMSERIVVVRKLPASVGHTKHFREKMCVSSCFWFKRVGGC